jgi:hypothetical protein
MILSERDEVTEVYRERERWSDRGMMKHRDIGIEGLRDCGMERKTKGWRDRGKEKYRDIGIEGLWDGEKEERVEGQGKGEIQGHRD